MTGALSGVLPSGQSLRRWLALLGAGGTFVLVVMLLRTPGASGYEPSMYSGYPTIFWILVVGTLLVGQGIILSAALDRAPETANWRIGFLLTGIVGGLLVYMPYLRGYPLYGRGDVLTHLGYVRDIHTTGGDPFQNIYQSIHQLVLALSYATGLEPIQVINGVAGVLSLFSIAASYALLSAIFDRRRALLTLPFVVVLVGGRAHMNPSPYAQSALLLPFVLYLFVKTQQTESFEMRAALAAAVIAVTLLHPLTGVFLILVFLAHYSVVFLSGQRGEDDPSHRISRITSTTVLQLSVVVFLAWYYNFVGIILRFETVFQRLLRPSTSETELDTYSATIAEFSPALTDLAQVALVWFGQRAVLLGIGSLFVVTVLVLYLRGKRPATPYLSTFGLGFVVFSALGVLFLLVDLIGGFGRPLIFAQFFAAFVAGSLLYQWYVHFDWQAGVTTAVTVVLVGLVVLSVFGLFHSPAGGESNHQVTHQELDGAQWYFEHDLDEEPLQEQGIRMYRFEHAFRGLDSNFVQQENTAPPGGFNYTEHPTLGDSYDQPQYFVLTEQARAFYPTVYPDYEADWRFHPDDYDRLERDPTVSHIYDAGEFDIYLIEPTED